MFKFLRNLFRKKEIYPSSDLLNTYRKREKSSLGLVEGEDYIVDEFEDGAFITCDGSLSPDQVMEIVKRQIIKQRNERLKDE